jgi:esterase/lipase superfamily enzyme
VGGKVWFGRVGSPGYRMTMQDRFQQYVREEVLPAIRTDCQSQDITVWTTGASIGAFHAAALVCRYPDVFVKALPMSGTFNLMRFIEVDHPNDDFRRASPLYFVPHLSGRHLELLRTRSIHIVTGEGKWESLKESWGLANVLGPKAIPNYVDSWGPKWDHDWVTWRAMLPKYLGEWTTPRP